MISRKSTLLLAESYVGDFQTLEEGFWVLKIHDLYDFLFENGFEAWFLNCVGALSKYNIRGMKELFMKLHTGESTVVATPKWSWEDRQRLGQRYLKDLSETMIKKYENKPPSRFVDVQGKVKALKSQLELDGYIYKDGILLRSESSVIDEKSEQSYLEHLLERASLPDKETVLHHVALAEDHFLNARWDDSISNSRKFLESILRQVANGINLKKYTNNLDEQMLNRAAQVRDFLEKEKLIETKEKEAIAKVYGLLSDTGSHPYIAEKDQARLMWHLSLTFCQFVLLRYEGFLKTSI